MKIATYALAALVCIVCLGCNHSPKQPAMENKAQPKAFVSQPPSAQSGQTQPQTSTLQPTVTAPASTAPTPASAAAPTPQAQSQETANAQITKYDEESELLVAGQKYRFVAHKLRLEHPRQKNDMDETVDSWELRAPDGSVVYQESALLTPAAVTDGSFEDAEYVDASTFQTKQGSGVIVGGDGLPSAPDSGGWTMVFGLVNGKMTLMGPQIYANEYLGLDVDPLRAAQEARSGGKLILMHDVLKFRLWTGNFNIIYPVLINWITGKLEPAWRCIKGAGTARVERCPYEVKADPFPVKERTFVRLFEEPDETLTPAHVVVEPGSKIEFLQAEVQVLWQESGKNQTSLGAQGEDAWLKIRVNGREGWIHSQEDFDAVGLPEAG